jgi:hypothetical protein
VPPGNQFAIVIYFCNLLFIIYFGNLFGKLFWIFFLFFFLNFGSGFFWVKIYIIKKNLFRFCEGGRIRGRLHGAFSMCVLMSDKPYVV